MTAQQAKTWAQSVRAKSTVEDKVDALAIAVAHLATAIANVESELYNIKKKSVKRKGDSDPQPKRTSEIP